MLDYLTISKLALEILWKDHYKPDLDKNQVIPLIKYNRKMYNDIQEAYYGGITEVYKPYREGLYYYDVNSLYPYVALSDMPGNKVTYQEFFTQSESNVDISKLFGFFYCEMESSGRYLGLLPVREGKRLIFPNGKWSDWYFSEELKYAKSNGYKIRVIKGYSFNKVSNVLHTFVKSLYAEKSNNLDISVKQTAKLLLNSLLGRFGLDIHSSVTDIVSDQELQYIAISRKIIYEKPITDDVTLVTFLQSLDPEICKKFKVDVSKIQNDRLTLKVDGKKNEHISVAISAAVTALEFYI